LTDVTDLLAPIRELHDEVRRTVVDACERASVDALSGIAADEAGDTIYEIDRVSERPLVDFFAREVAPRAGVVLVGEGIERGRVVLPRGTREEDARWRVIVDPIDGTRALMYQKRSGWVLTGVAPNRGPATTLSDIELAVQTEIPTLKQHLCDVLWAIRGGGARAERVDRVTGARTPIHLRPSSARTIAHGFAMVARFFPGAREELAAIDEEIAFGALGPPQPGKAHLFEDQYISSGGQLYELMAGHDRFVADIRPLMNRHLAKTGKPMGLCCHPYDLATALIAREAGVIVTDERGHELDAPLSVQPDVAWIGYANAAIRAQVEPLLQNALRKRGLL
jgi:fructose-1,6-bisphosphatase/inositol monophosphatase family enzyme